jgi:glycosyltransferase involved in cell wall biosynthesis
MRIVHVITSINRGGAENHLLDLALAQRSRGFKVFVFYLKGDGYWRLKLESQGVKVFNLHLKFYGDIFPIFRLKALFSNIKPDIVHAHMPPAEVYSYLSLAFCSSRPYFIISKHNDERFYDGPFSKVISKMIASKSKKIIAISNAVHSYFRSVFNSESIQIKTIHYGLDTTIYQSVSNSEVLNFRKSFFVGPDVILFGTIARLASQKSLDTLLKAFALYKNQSTFPSKLMVVGAGPLEDFLKKISLDLGISQDVIWTGFRDDIPIVMNSFDVFMLTSKYEGFGLVLLEAMAASKPIIATSVSAIPEIVVQNVTGLLCEAGDIDAISSAMKKLEAKKLRLKIGTAGYLKVLKSFSLNKMIKETQSFYEEVLKEI